MPCRRTSFALLCWSLACASCAGHPGDAATKGAGSEKKGPLAFAVEVAPVALRSVIYSVSAVGSVQAYDEIQVTARVVGAVEAVYFTEGDTVAADQVLVEIEPRRFQLALDSAHANVQRAIAARDDARKSLQRRQKLGQEGIAAAEEVDVYRTKVATLEADLAQAKVAVSLAELNLRDARVRAGVAGVVQTRPVHAGQYVQLGAVLATLVQREPLMLRFKVAQQDAARLGPGIKAHFTVHGVKGDYEATIIHVAQSADETSRMVAAAARIDQPDPALRPGSFAEVTVPIGAPAPAPVIPLTAVRPSEKGFLAFVIEAGKARERVLTLGMRTEDGQVEVRSGVQPGESLVVVGAEALREGAAVRIAATVGKP